MQVPEICFENGTLRIAHFAPDTASPALRELCRRDERGNVYRAKGCDYASIVIEYLTCGIRPLDRAKSFEAIELPLQKPLIPRPHQQRALDDWQKAGRRGIVVLPTGAGKTILAVMAIAATRRPALVLVPTIDLLQQWTSVLEGFFGVEVGMLGGENTVAFL